MILATTEIHHVAAEGNRLVLVNCASRTKLKHAPFTREGVLLLLGHILDIETPTPEQEPKAINFTSAAWDQEFQRREHRDEVLHGLCAQIELSQGKQPWPTF